MGSTIITISGVRNGERSSRFIEAMKGSDATALKKSLDEDIGFFFGAHDTEKNEVFYKLAARGDQAMNKLVLDHLQTSHYYIGDSIYRAREAIYEASKHAHPDVADLYQQAIDALWTKIQQRNTDESYMKAVSNGDAVGTKAALKKGANISTDFNRAVDKAVRSRKDAVLNVILTEIKDRYEATVKAGNGYAVSRAAHDAVETLTYAFKKARRRHEATIKPVLNYFKNEQQAMDTTENRQRHIQELLKKLNAK